MESLPSPGDFVNARMNPQQVAFPFAPNAWAHSVHVGVT